MAMRGRSFFLLLLIAVTCTAEEKKQTSAMKRVKNYLLSHGGQDFDPSIIDDILLDMRLKVLVEIPAEDAGDEEEEDFVLIANLAPKVAPELEAYEHVISFDNLVNPYSQSDHPVRSFVNRIFNLNARNPIIVRFVDRLVAKYGYDSKIWDSLIAHELKHQPAECRRHADVTRMIREVLHYILVLDGLTRAMYKDPTGLMATANEYYLTLLERVDISGVDVFFLVKFPSVLKPINEFVKASVIRSPDKQKLMAKYARAFRLSNDDYKQLVASELAAASLVDEKEELSDDEDPQDNKKPSGKLKFDKSSSLENKNAARSQQSDPNVAAAAAAAFAANVERAKASKVDLRTLSVSSPRGSGSLEQYTNSSYGSSIDMPLFVIGDVADRFSPGPHVFHAQALGDMSLEEDEEEGYERMVLYLMDKIVKADPTEALRLNILEASVAALFLFSGRTDLVKKGKYPPSSLGGFVLANDAMYGQPRGCDKSCEDSFSRGKFTFSHSFQWQNLYSGWNLAMMLAATSLGDWWGKLITPAVVEDLTGETYIIRRTIALWLTLFRKTFRHDDWRNDDDECRNNYVLSGSLELQHMMGEEVWKYAREYANHWRQPETACVVCFENFHKDKAKHRIVDYVLRAVAPIGATIRAVKSIVKSAVNVIWFIAGKASMIENLG